MQLSYDPEKLKLLLTQGGHIDDLRYRAALEDAERLGQPIEISLVERGDIKDRDLGEVIAKEFGVPFVDLGEQGAQNEAFEVLSEVVARAQGAVVFAKEGEDLSLGITNPDNIEFIDSLEKLNKGKVSVYYATPYGLREAFKNYKDNLYKTVKDLIEDYEVNKNESSPVTLVDRLLDYAYENIASDIHIEPAGDNMVSVRFRVDGVLYEVTRYPIDMHRPVVSRIKIMSHLRTDESDATQDGRFDYTKDKVKFDVRVSILPITHGESVVLRILSEKSRKMVLEDLGLLDEDLEKVKRAIDKPYGMIVVVGPTGAGKTTTLYSIMLILNQLPINIVTIEDPVEYSVTKVQQIQVNLKKNITFANGLREIVRQDPDVIMVGEIRDNETASIAVNASMTGHMLLSTMHANDAATIFPRLSEMGVEPFLVASSVNVVIAQRLVRKVCSYCKILYPPHPENLEEIRRIKDTPEFINLMTKHFPGQRIEDLKLYKGTGCKNCNHTGYLGRVGIFEVMEIDDDIRDLIIKKSSASSIESKAVQNGMISMFYNGVGLVFKGQTTFEEILGLTN
jgi:type IV pilus assembly protein PilB